jgi:hypothetical protein
MQYRMENDGGLPMLVFLSWSGQRSKLMAEALETWLSQVIQAVEPWISSDIEKGARWGSEIADKLERSKIGIICLTRDNLDARWILFEAGALSKMKDAYVCTLLLDIKPSDVEQPLAQFQHTTIDKNDIYQLLQAINRAVQKSGERALAENVLSDVFETYWIRLEKKFEEAVAKMDSVTNPVRSEREMLQEILEMLRNQERRQIRDEERLTALQISKIINRLFDSQWSLKNDYTKYSSILDPSSWEQVAKYLGKSRSGKTGEEEKPKDDVTPDQEEHLE